MNYQITSAISAQENKVALLEKKAKVLSVIENCDQNEGISNREIATKLGIETATVSGLTRPLVLSGVVVELKKRPCKITGHVVIAWGKRKTTLF